MKKVLITPRGFHNYGGFAKAQLENLGFELDINDTGKALPKEVFEEKAKASEAIIVGVDSLHAELLDECKNLKLIVKFGVGTDNIDLKKCEELGIQVERCLGTNSNAVAELTVGLMFDLARSISTNVAEVKAGLWNKPTGIELSGKKVGIIGFGNIGKLVASKALGLGMSVCCYDNYTVAEDVLNKYEASQVSLEELYQQSDFITLHVPLTNDTKGMISTKEFEMMKNTAILVNSARGGIIDEEALYTALTENKIGGCATDVAVNEPMGESKHETGLLSHDKFILTAHIASRTIESEINTVKEATRHLIEF